MAYQTSACNAIEGRLRGDALPELLALRRLLYCGVDPQPHLHMYMLHGLPRRAGRDRGGARSPRGRGTRSGAGRKRATGCRRSSAAARSTRQRPGWRLLLDPYPCRSRADGRGVAPALDHALDTVTWVAGFDFPDLTVDHELLALTGDRYPLEGGTIAPQRRTALPIAGVQRPRSGTHVAHSTACMPPWTAAPPHRADGPPQLNHERLSPLAREAAAAAGLGDECQKPFRSIVVRAVETVYAVEEALRIIDDYQRPARPTSRSNRAWSRARLEQAPRGLLYHRYQIDESGISPPRWSSRRHPEPGGHRSRPDQVRFLAGVDLDDAALTAMILRAGHPATTTRASPQPPISSP